MGFSKNRGGKPPKMDGENHEKPYFLMDDLGGKQPLFLETPIWNCSICIPGSLIYFRLVIGGSITEYIYIQLIIES